MKDNKKVVGDLKKVFMSLPVTHSIMSRLLILMGLMLALTTPGCTGGNISALPITDANEDTGAHDCEQHLEMKDHVHHMNHENCSFMGENDYCENYMQHEDCKKHLEHKNWSHMGKHEYWMNKSKEKNYSHHLEHKNWSNHF